MFIVSRRKSGAAVKVAAGRLAVRWSENRVGRPVGLIVAINGALRYLANCNYTTQGLGRIDEGDRNSDLKGPPVAFDQQFEPAGMGTLADAPAHFRNRIVGGKPNVVITDDMVADF